MRAEAAESFEHGKHGGSNHDNQRHTSTAQTVANSSGAVCWSARLGGMVVIHVTDVLVIMLMQT